VTDGTVVAHEVGSALYPLNGPHNRSPFDQLMANGLDNHIFPFVLSLSKHGQRGEMIPSGIWTNGG
jgi:hypothetical protein